MSLATIVQGAIDICAAIPRISNVTGGSSPDARQMLAIANRSVGDIARRTAWQRLTKEKTFTSIASETQTGALPTDLDRFVAETFYNRSMRRQVIGPLDSRQWQLQKALTANFVTDAFRVRGGAILLMPVPAAGLTYAYEYVSKNWATSSDGLTERTAGFVADSDVSLIDEFLVTLDIVWRWKAAKGLDYAEDFRTAEMKIVDAIARDGARTTISMSGQRIAAGPRINVPEGSWAL